MNRFMLVSRLFTPALQHVGLVKGIISKQFDSVNSGFPFKFRSFAAASGLRDLEISARSGFHSFIRFKAFKSLSKHRFKLADSNSLQFNSNVFKEKL